MSRKQYAPPAKSHEAKKTRKELKAELQAEREKFEETQGETAAPQLEELPPVEPTEDEKGQLQRLLIFGVVGTIALLAIMYWIFVSNQ